MSLWKRLTDHAAAIVAPHKFRATLLGNSSLSCPAKKDPRRDIVFTMAIIALSAKMAKSDGAVTQDEVEAFKRLAHVPASEIQNVRRLFDLAKRDVAGYEHYARQANTLLRDDPDLKRDVMEALFVIAASDGVLHEKEDRYLATMATLLEILPSELGYIRSRFVYDASDPYAVLGLSPSATDEELIATRRRLVLETHPDRLIGRGVPAEFSRLAERRLASVNAAYDIIAQERGFARGARRSREAR